ncbi:MAG: hypothetical protein SOZ90_02115 [Candidatus Faecousia sp.]|nr:hypothetical protein [Candidatus Faecousia sp.]
MKIRGLLFGLVGLVVLLFPGLLPKLLQKSHEEEATLLRLNRILGVALVAIGVFIAVVDN